ncbi:MAG: CheR family methyltransferase [Candidatus Hodarchaeales archaeon]|jgi:chemotaxis protein methyltransferase CheR
MYPDQQNLALIKQFLYKRGFSDISSYKEKYLIRRLTIRMRKRNCNTFEAYYDDLSQNANEIKLLKKSLSINVTEFFRDLDTWDEFQRLFKQYIYKLNEKTFSPLVRIWSAGCAVGPEPYSIACVVHHIIGKKLLKYNIKIYASDFNEELLQIARRGIYQGEILTNIPREFLLKYFERFGRGLRVKYNIRRMIEFSYLNLMRDKFTFPKLNVIFCRNVLIYFGKDIQRVIFRKFYDLLVPGGYLILGRTEILPPSFRKSFKITSLRHRIYKKRIDSEPPPKEKRITQKRILKCSKCGQKFDDLVDLRLHERKNTCRQFRCRFCLKSFDTEIRIRAHEKYFHPDRK